jgi:hypothetical protein
MAKTIEDVDFLVDMLRVAPPHCDNLKDVKSMPPSV